MSAAKSQCIILCLLISGFGSAFAQSARPGISSREERSQKKDRISNLDWKVKNMYSAGYEIGMPNLRNNAKATETWEGRYVDMPA